MRTKSDVRTRLIALVVTTVMLAFAASATRSEISKRGTHALAGKDLIWVASALKAASHIALEETSSPVHAGGFNLGLVMRHLIGNGTPRGLRRC